MTTDAVPGGQADSTPLRLDFTWELRLANATGLPLLLHACLVAAATAATFFVPGYLLGYVPVPLPDASPAWPVDPYSWGAIVTSIMTGFTAVSLPYVTRRRAQDIAELDPVVPSLSARDLQELYARCAVASPRGRIAATAAGYGAGFLIPVFSVPGGAQLLGLGQVLEPADLPQAAYVAAMWFVVVVPLLIASLAKATFIMINGARLLFREIDRAIEVDPLDADALRPLANAGLRTALVLLVGEAVGTLFLLNANIDPQGIVLFMVFIGFLAGIAAVSPAMFGARVIRRAKQRAMAPLRAAIARARERTLADPDDDGAAARLGALLAYEHRLREAREMPFGTPAIGRFALYMLIPLGSWLGGAFVERLVDAALG